MKRLHRHNYRLLGGLVAYPNGIVPGTPEFLEQSVWMCEGCDRLLTWEPIKYLLLSHRGKPRISATEGE